MPTGAAPPLARAVAEVSAGAMILGGALPLLFLHADYQPSADLTVGSASVTIRLSDIAVLAVAAAAAATLQGRVRHLRAARWGWLVSAALVAWVVASTGVRAGVDGYDVSTHLVTALKFGEYALLAPALVLLIRTARDLTFVAWAVVVWVGAAALVAVLQVLGVDMLGAWTPGRRQPSFIGHHDLAAVAAVALAVGTAWILLGVRSAIPRSLGRAAAATGTVALVVSGTVVGAAGFALGAALALLATWRRARTTAREAARLGCLVVVVAVGVLAFRGGDVLDFARFLGIGPAEEKTTDVESYSHRSVLAYIGGRIFLDHPLVGVGWQASSTERGYGPFVDDARARFPTVADEAFPAPGREWGVQDAYIQAAADLGAPGALLFLGLVLAPVGLVARSLRRGAHEHLAFAVVVLVLASAVAALWVAQGLVSGIPLAAVTWLALGLAAWLADRCSSRRG